MITVARLKELIAGVPDDAQVIGYEGEECGISIERGEREWWFIKTGDTSDPVDEPIEHHVPESGA